MPFVYSSVFFIMRGAKLDDNDNPYFWCARFDCGGEAAHFFLISGGIPTIDKIVARCEAHAHDVKAYLHTEISREEVNHLFITTEVHES